MDHSLPRLRLRGAPVTAADLHALALAPYGHFTSMQVRDGAVRGLDLHLERLAAATRALFDHPLSPARVRTELRAALDGQGGGLSLRLNVFARGLGMREPDAAAEPELLVTLLPPAGPAAAPLRVRSTVHGRYLPAIKHVGTFELLHQRRLARREGWDDALFVDARGEIAEGSIWNVGFVSDDGGLRVTWPSAPALPGISQQLLQQALAARGIATETRPVRLSELGRFRGAFFSNCSHAVQPIAQIDTQTFAADAEVYGPLSAAYEALPWDAI
ncbi:MAG: aminodeoxychorismate lyase [Nevskiaceae bacterium]|nr:MAG: aminodeoxychorismate lyase [Nevskiaceae bacterium]